MTKSKNLKNSKGFTLIELMVAVSIFVLIMTVTMGSILSVFDINRKAQNLRSVMDNLNTTLESMTRTIRFGTDYHCDILVGNLSSPRDCSDGASSIEVTSSLGSRVRYIFANGRIERYIDSIGPSYLTGSDVTITNLKFYVFGTGSFSGGDLAQPRVIMVVSGYSGTKESSRSSFTIQTTVSQRLFDTQ